MRLGIPAFVFAAAINILSLLGLGLVLLRIAEASNFSMESVGGCGCRGMFPQIFAAASGFAVLPDALLLALLVFSVLKRRAGQAALTALFSACFVPMAWCLLCPPGLAPYS